MTAVDHSSSCSWSPRYKALSALQSPFSRITVSSHLELLLRNRQQHKLKMLRFVLAICLVAFAASDDSCCSALDQSKLKAAWNSLWNTGDASSTKLIFGREVFRRFVAENPGSEALFARVDFANFEGPDFSTHVIRVLTGLDLVIHLLGENDAYDAEVEHLNAQHLKRTGVTEAYFQSFLDILVDTLAVVLDDYDGISYKNCLHHAVHGISHNLP